MNEVNDKGNKMKISKVKKAAGKGKIAENVVNQIINGTRRFSKLREIDVIYRLEREMPCSFSVSRVDFSGDHVITLKTNLDIE